MKKKTLKKVIITAGLLFCVILFLCFVEIEGRVEILSDYKKLISDPEILQRLETVPPVKKIKFTPDEEAFSIGYASFSFPFGEIESIRKERSRIRITCNDITMILNELLFVPKNPLSRAELEKNLPIITFAGSSPKLLDEKFYKYEINLQERYYHVMKYEKKMCSVVPKSKFSLVFMKFDELYIYEKLLENKNQLLIKYDVIFLETEVVKVLVEKTKLDKNNITLIWVYDTDSRIIQCIHMHYTDSTTSAEVEQLIASFSFDMNLIMSEDFNLEKAVHEALIQNDKYIDEAPNKAAESVDIPVPSEEDVLQKLSSFLETGDDTNGSVEYSEKVRSVLLPEAQKQAKELYPNNKEHQEGFVWDFIRGFIHALKDTGGKITRGDGKGPEQIAHDRGQAFYERLLESSTLDVTLEDFGYRRMKVEGRYRIGFELSEFCPKGTNEKWWIWFGQDMLSEWAHSEGISLNGIFKKPKKCKFDGYLAPSTDYGVGHMNMYDREFVVTEIIEIVY